MDIRRLVVWISAGILGFQGATLALDLLNCTALSWFYVRRYGLEEGAERPAKAAEGRRSGWCAEQTPRSGCNTGVGLRLHLRGGKPDPVQQGGNLSSGAARSGGRLLQGAPRPHRCRRQPGSVHPGRAGPRGLIGGWEQRRIARSNVRLPLLEPLPVTRHRPAWKATGCHLQPAGMPGGGLAHGLLASLQVIQQRAVRVGELAAIVLTNGEQSS